MGPPGHLGIGFAAKRVAPKAPLWVLLVATEVLDLLSFLLMTIGIERMGITSIDLSQGIQYLSPASVPWSHGLFMSVVWSVLAGAIGYIVYRDRRTGLVLGLVVFSHWVLDLIVHLPDLPLLFDGSPLVGLGLWGSGSGLVISGILELALLAAGIAIYVITRKRKPVQALGQ
jgi:hypothetical protein